MLACSRLLDFVYSAKDFLAYRENENKLMYKIQKNIVKGFFKNIKRKIVEKQEEKISILQLKEDHYKKIEKVREIAASKCLVKLLRIKKTTLEKNYAKLKSFLHHKLFQLLHFNFKKSILKKECQTAKKVSVFPCLK